MVLRLRVFVRRLRTCTQLLSPLLTDGLAVYSDCAPCSAGRGHTHCIGRMAHTHCVPLCGHTTQRMKKFVGRLPLSATPLFCRVQLVFVLPWQRCVVLSTSAAHDTAQDFVVCLCETVACAALAVARDAICPYTLCCTNSNVLTLERPGHSTALHWTHLCTALDVPRLPRGAAGLARHTHSEGLDV
jgi:hypothetical protein